MAAALARRGICRCAHLGVALRRPLVVTAGEPAGIGPELCTALLESPHASDVVVIGDARQLDSRLNVIDLPYPELVRAGHPSKANAATLLSGLDMAVDGCLSGDFSGLVTAPLAKHIVASAAPTFSGHTEYLAKRTNSEQPVMLLVAADLRVALVTTHLPLRAVPDAISTQRIIDVGTVLDGDLKRRFGIAKPRIVVCGLNPHAGEEGLLGHEDDAIIRPAIETLQKLGIGARGPVPADTAFTPAAGEKDAVLAMYHDQGLPVLKFAGFGHAVNVTLGLPIIRTSVDHGTAFDIAGTGKADPGSLLAAVDLAAMMAAR